MPTIVTGHVTRDAAGLRPLVTPIGPFPGSTEARIFMEALGPLWGSWQIENLASTDLRHYNPDPPPPYSMPIRRAVVKFLSLPLTSQLELLRNLGFEAGPIVDVRTAHDVTVPRLLAEVRERGLVVDFVAAVIKRAGDA